MCNCFKYLFFLFAFSLISEAAYPATDNSLLSIYKQCKEIIVSNPDSAYTILQNTLSQTKLNSNDSVYPYFLMLVGEYHRMSGNYDSSYTNYAAALNLFEKRKNINLIAENQINIGILYDLQQDQKSAIKKYYTALKNYLFVNDTLGIVKAYMNLGIAYKNIGTKTSKNTMLDSAFVNYNNAERYLDRNKEPHALSKLYINIGNLKYVQQHFVRAIYYYKKAAKISETHSYNKDLALALDNLGWAHRELKEYKVALAFSLRGLKIARKIGSKYNVANSLINISEIYHELHNYKEAHSYLGQFVAINDSLINESTIALQNKLEGKYESEKKDNEISLLNKEKEKDTAIALAEKKKKNTIIFAIAFGLVLVLIFSFFMYNRFKVSQRQKKIIENQKELVDQKNKDITDSINYAKRIQTALLKEEDHVSKNLPPHFIFFQAKDIVSGDFYWTTQKKEFLYLAVADCTGHGVPGAFLTMLGTAFLNEITAQEGVLEPAKILNELRSKFISELGQTGKEGESRDGMDVSLVRLNLLSNEVAWAGANNPLWIITANQKLIKTIDDKRAISENNKTLISISPNKQPIGYYHKTNPFTNHKIQLQPEDTLYLFSDGFADQFGGEKGKKLMYKPFKKLLLSFLNLEMNQQKEELSNAFKKWKGSQEQIDDVCVVGIKIV